jgi:hypothetical protein
MFLEMQRLTTAHEQLNSWEDIKAEERANKLNMDSKFVECSRWSERSLPRPYLEQKNYKRELPELVLIGKKQSPS